LSQFDNDPDEEINDLDDHLEMLVEDSSSEDLEDEESQNQAKDIKADANEVKAHSLNFIWSQSCQNFLLHKIDISQTSVQQPPSRPQNCGRC
jgi:hypothetical protein